MAEFTEVIKQKDRMCTNYESCDSDCPMHTLVGAYDEIACTEYLVCYPEKAEKAIMKWAEEHPIMTNAQKFKEVFGCEIHRGGCDCIGIEYNCIVTSPIDCENCEWKGFWGKEY